MDRRLLRYYDRELRHLQTVSQEFAREFPKIAGRLALDDVPCADPYVERMLEGFAYLAARVQLKLDAEFPRFTQNLLETVYPHYLAPTPSMCVVQMLHDPGESGLAEGFKVPRQAVLRAQSGVGSTGCEYRTAHDLTLWPLEIEEARYYTRDAGVLELHRPWGGEAATTSPVRAALRIRIRTSGGVPLRKLALDDLTVYLKGGDATPMRLYEQIFGRATGVVIRPAMAGNRRGDWEARLPAANIHRRGFDESESLLPYEGRSFQGYRLLHEYFAFPERFLFAQFRGIGDALRRVDGVAADLIVTFSDENRDLDGAVDGSNFALNCVPAVNLFPKRTDRIFITEKTSEFQVIPDRTRPLDFEVYRVRSVTGFGSRSGQEREFRPFYAAKDSDGDADQAPAYYAVHRAPRARSERERLKGGRSSYAGSELSISIVDAEAAPYSLDLKQLAVEALCTNRDLPLQMPVGKGKSDFALEHGAPVIATRIVAGPTPPRPSHAEGDTAWRLISHLTLNYLSLADNGGGDHADHPAAAALRDVLKLYSDLADPAIRKQTDGIREVTTRAITRRAPAPGAIGFVRGLEIGLTFEELMYEGTGVFLLGAVLEQFFARYVTTNSFTETVIRTVERGEIMRWKARVGQRPML